MDTDRTVNIYDTRGNSLYHGQINGELIQILPFQDRVYLLLENKVVEIQVATGTVREAPTSPNPLYLVADEQSVVVCYTGGALAVAFESLS